MHGWRAHVVARFPARGSRVAPGTLATVALALAAAGCGSSSSQRAGTASPPAPATVATAPAPAISRTADSAPAAPPPPVAQAPAPAPTPTPAAAADTSIAKAASAACSAASRRAPAEAAPPGSVGTSQAASAARFASRYVLLTRRLGALSRLHAAGLEGVRLRRLETILRRLRSLDLRASRGGGAALRSAIARVERTATAAAIVAGTRACAPPGAAGRAGAASGAALPPSTVPNVEARPRRHVPPVRPASEGQP